MNKPNKTLSLNFHPSMLVIDVKKKIQDEEGILTASQKLIYAGKTLDDEKSLIDYNILKGATFHLFVKE